MLSETPDYVQLGSITNATSGAPGSFVEMQLGNGLQTACVTFTGTFVGTVVFEASSDNATYASIPGLLAGGTLIDTQNTVTNVAWVFQVAGLQSLRMRCSAYTSGTINVRMQSTLGLNARLNSDVGHSLFPTGSQAAGTYNSADQQNSGARGIKVVIDVTAATGTLVVNIQGKDPVSGKYYTILSSASLGVGTTTLTVYPGIAVTANQSASDILPSTWRINAVVSTNPVTATIAGSLNA